MQSHVEPIVGCLLEKLCKLMLRALEHGVGHIVDEADMDHRMPAQNSVGGLFTAFVNISRSVQHGEPSVFKTQRGPERSVSAGPRCESPKKREPRCDSIAS